MDLLQKKRTFLKKKHGLFKALVYILLQQQLFVKTINKFISNSALIDNTERIILIQKIFDYSYSTRDMWSIFDVFSQEFKRKVIEFCSENPSFKQYLYMFGYICKYTKRNGKPCDKKTDNGMCKIHLNCALRLKKRIANSIPSLPHDISKIIFEYTT